MMEKPGALRAPSEQMLGGVELFSDLKPAGRRELMAVCERLEFSAGEILFHQGEVADALYIVGSGELQVRAKAPSGEDIQLARLGPGSVVGEISLIAGGPRSATVQALADATVLRLSHQAFDELRQARSRAAYQVILRLAKILGNRRRVTDERVDQVFSDPGQYLDDFEAQLHGMLGRLKKA